MSSEPTYTFKPTKPVLVHRGFKPNHNMTFHNQDGKQIGALDFNGPEMTFTGDADESAKLFFDLIARSFKERLEQERADERERICKAIKTEDDYCVDEGDYMLDSDDCIAVAKGEWVRPDYSVDAIRARGNT